MTSVSVSIILSMRYITYVVMAAMWMPALTLGNNFYIVKRKTIAMHVIEQADEVLVFW